MIEYIKNTKAYKLCLLL